MQKSNITFVNISGNDIKSIRIRVVIVTSAIVFRLAGARIRILVEKIVIIVFVNVINIQIIFREPVFTKLACSILLLVIVHLLYFGVGVTTGRIIAMPDAL